MMRSFYMVVKVKLSVEVTDIPRANQRQTLHYIVIYFRRRRSRVRRVGCGANITHSAVPVWARYQIVDSWGSENQMPSTYTSTKRFVLTKDEKTIHNYVRSGFDYGKKATYRFLYECFHKRDGFNGAVIMVRLFFCGFLSFILLLTSSPAVPFRRRWIGFIWVPRFRTRRRWRILIIWIFVPYWPVSEFDILMLPHSIQHLNYF